MHECMSDYAGGTLGAAGTSSVKGVEVGTSGTGRGEGCGGGGLGAENG